MIPILWVRPLFRIGKGVLVTNVVPGANVNFDLCKDDGAAAALFNSSGVTAAKGTAELVSCDLWSGSADITS